MLLLTDQQLMRDHDLMPFMLSNFGNFIHCRHLADCRKQD